MYRITWPGALAAGLLTACGASAQTWSLAWARGAGAETCIDGPALAAAVERRLGRVPFGPPSEATVVLEGLVRREGEAWSAFVAIRDRQGATLGVREHHVDGADCGALDEPLALIVALLIDPSGTFASAPPAPLPPPAPTPAPPRSDTAAPSAEPVPSEAEGLGTGVVTPPPAKEPAPMKLGVLPSLGVGQLALWTPGLRVELGTVVWRVGVALAVESWWPTQRALGAGTARLSQVGLDASVCPLRWSFQRAELDACVTALIGVLVVEGQGFAVNRTGASPVLDVGLRTRGSWPVGPRVELTLGLGARGHLLQTRVASLDELGQIVSTSRGLPLAVDAGAGVLVRLW